MPDWEVTNWKHRVQEIHLRHVEKTDEWRVDIMGNDCPLADAPLELADLVALKQIFAKYLVQAQEG